MTVSYGEITSVFNILDKCTQNITFSQKTRSYSHAILMCFWDLSNDGKCIFLMQFYFLKENAEEAHVFSPCSILAALPGNILAWKRNIELPPLGELESQCSCPTEN